MTKEKMLENYETSVRNFVSVIRRDIGSFIGNKTLDEILESYRHNDDGHLIDHIFYVMRNGRDLSNYFELTRREKAIVYAACLMHDLGCRYDRDTHHEISANMVRQILRTDGNFTEEEIEQVSLCCLEHRASFKGTHSSKLSRIVAVADRGVPQTKTLMKRTLQYNISKGDLTKEEIIGNAVFHLADKYNLTTGYMWRTYPEEGRIFFGNGWALIADWVLDAEALTSYAEEIYKELTCTSNTSSSLSH